MLNNLAQWDARIQYHSEKKKELRAETSIDHSADHYNNVENVDSG